MTDVERHPRPKPLLKYELAVRRRELALKASKQFDCYAPLYNDIVDLVAKARIQMAQIKATLCRSRLP